MQLNIGQKIRELRRRDGRTQEAFAEALGVTSQAVSRWEAGVGYPDMETVPAIANYFHVSIDELFGYSSDREEKIKEILGKADKALKKQGAVISKGSLTEEVGECIDMLRTASEEFPNEPKIFLKLADALHMWGWHKHGVTVRTDDGSGITDFDIEYNTQNVYWQEALLVYERVLKSDPSPEDRERAICGAAPLYCRMGKYKEAKALADAQNSITVCREMLLPMATTGEEKAHYQGERITALLSNLQKSLFESISSNPAVNNSEYQSRIILSVINLYETVFNDGRCGLYHWNIGYLYLRLAHNEAILGGDIRKVLEYFDRGFDHCKEFERFYNGGEYSYSAPLVSKLKTHKKDKFPPIGESFLKAEASRLPESIRSELFKNKKYAECFE